MKRTLCPACGRRVSRDYRNDAYRIRRAYDMCQNSDCRERGWEMAVSREEWRRGQERQAARQGTVVAA